MRLELAVATLRAMLKPLLLVLLVCACGSEEPCSEPPPPSSCLPDYSWCIIADGDGGARIIGGP